ncbi:hypothetical protein SHIRM173S_08087 [Streptomyces hirsutus]
MPTAAKTGSSPLPWSTPPVRGPCPPPPAAAVCALSASARQPIPSATASPTSRTRACVPATPASAPPSSASVPPRSPHSPHWPIWLGPRAARKRDGLGTSPRYLRLHLGGGEADQLPARGALGPSQSRRRRRPRRGGHRLSYRGCGARRRRPTDPDRRGRPTPGRSGRSHRPDRIPPRPVLPLRGAPAPGRAPAGTGGTRPSDRPQPALLRHRLPARPPGTVRPGIRHLPRRHEELRPCSHVPGYDRLRADPFRGGRPGRRYRRGRPRGTGPPETGVCGGSGLFDTADTSQGSTESRCAPVDPQPIQLTTVSPGSAAVSGSCCSA